MVQALGRVLGGGRQLVLEGPPKGGDGQQAARRGVGVPQRGGNAWRENGAATTWPLAAVAWTSVSWARAVS